MWLDPPPDVTTFTVPEVVGRIAALHEQMYGFWASARGWAPDSAADLLSAARLDWQIELARTLRIWIEEPPPGEEQARLILGWANLGALVEGALKLLLAVYIENYEVDADAKRKRSGDLVLPDVLRFEDLRQFYAAADLLSEWHGWIETVQQRRNAIHAFKERDLGTHEEFREAVRQYLEFLRDLNGQLPYPDGGYEPRERPVGP